MGKLWSAGLLAVAGIFSGCFGDQLEYPVGPTGSADGLGTPESPFVFTSLSVQDQQSFVAYLDGRSHEPVECTANGQSFQVTFPGKSGACEGILKVTYVSEHAYWTCLPNVGTTGAIKREFARGIFDWQCGNERLQGPIGTQVSTDFWGLFVVSVAEGYWYWATCGDPWADEIEPSFLCEALPAVDGATTLERYRTRGEWAAENASSARACGELITDHDLGLAGQWASRVASCAAIEIDCESATAALAENMSVPDSNLCR